MSQNTKLTRNNNGVDEDTKPSSKVMEQPFSADSYVRDEEDDMDWEYNPDEDYRLPVQLDEWFKTQGLDTRWVRYVIQGQMDMENMNKKKKKGYDFVTREELPNNYADNYDVSQVDSMKDYVARKDVVLMKVPMWKKAKVVDYLDKRAKQQVDIVKDLLRQNTGAERLGDVDLINESKTKVTGGGQREVSFANKKAKE